MLALAAFVVALAWIILVVVHGPVFAWLLPLVLLLVAAHLAFGDRIRRV